VRVTLDDEEQGDIVEGLLAEYRLTLQEDRRKLFDRFTPVDMVRQVVGVGSVGMVVYLVLLEGSATGDPLFLQCKQAGTSVYESYTYASEHDNHGARVIAGKRMVQSATDIFVGWGSLGERDFYVRQFRDMKLIPTTEPDRARPGRVRHRLRQHAGPGARPLRRPRRHRRLHGQERRVHQGHAPNSPAATPTRTSGTTQRCWPPSGGARRRASRTDLDEPGPWPGTPGPTR
jgi:hypothetical protein